MRAGVVDGLNLLRSQNAIENLQLIQATKEIRPSKVGCAIGADAERYIVKKGACLGGNQCRRIGDNTPIKVP